MKLSNKYKTSEYIFLFSILVLALLLGTYFSFYAFLWRDIESEVKGFSKDHSMNFMFPSREGLTKMQTNLTPGKHPLVLRKKSDTESYVGHK